MSNGLMQVVRKKTVNSDSDRKEFTVNHLIMLNPSPRPSGPTTSLPNPDSLMAYNRRMVEVRLFSQRLMLHNFVRLTFKFVYQKENPPSSRWSTEVRLSKWHGTLELEFARDVWELFAEVWSGISDVSAPPDHSCPPRGWLMQGWESEFLENTHCLIPIINNRVIH